MCATSTMCRTCLSTSGTHLSLFDYPSGVDSETLSLGARLSQITTLRPTQLDGLPRKVCWKCAQEISQSYLFKVQCESTDTTLRELLKPTNTPDKTGPIVNIPDKIICVDVGSDGLQQQPENYLLEITREEMVPDEHMKMPVKYQSVDLTDEISDIQIIDAYNNNSIHEIVRNDVPSVPEATGPLFKCPYCRSAFQLKRLLRYHLVTSNCWLAYWYLTGHKRKISKRGFKRRNMYAHVRTRTHLKVPIKKITSKFRFGVNLIGHKMIHGDDNKQSKKDAQKLPVIAAVKSLGEVSQDELIKSCRERQLRVIVERLKTYRCKKCTRIFLRKEQLLSHTEKEHAKKTRRENDNNRPEIISSNENTEEGSKICVYRKVDIAKMLAETQEPDQASYMTINLTEKSDLVGSDIRSGQSTKSAITNSYREGEQIDIPKNSNECTSDIFTVQRSNCKSPSLSLCASDSNGNKSKNNRVGINNEPNSNRNTFTADLRNSRERGSFRSEQNSQDIISHSQNNVGNFRLIVSRSGFNSFTAQIAPNESAPRQRIYVRKPSELLAHDSHTLASNSALGVESSYHLNKGNENVNNIQQARTTMLPLCTMTTTSEMKNAPNMLQPIPPHSGASQNLQPTASRIQVNNNVRETTKNTQFVQYSASTNVSNNRNASSGAELNEHMMSHTNLPLLSSYSDRNGGTMSGNLGVPTQNSRQKSSNSHGQMKTFSHGPPPLIGPYLPKNHMTTASSLRGDVATSATMSNNSQSHYLPNVSYRSNMNDSERQSPSTNYLHNSALSNRLQGIVTSSFNVASPHVNGTQQGVNGIISSSPTNPEAPTDPPGYANISSYETNATSNTCTPVNFESSRFLSSDVNYQQLPFNSHRSQAGHFGNSNEKNSKDSESYISIERYGQLISNRIQENSMNISLISSSKYNANAAGNAKGSRRRQKPVTGSVRRFQCSRCSEEFQVEEALLYHLRTSLCGQEVAQTHLTTSTKCSQTLRPFSTCDQCHYKFYNLSDHVCRSPNVAKSNQTMMTSVCNICNVFFTSQQGLDLHLANSHNSERTFSCIVCSKTFRRHSDLMQHELNHSNNTEKSFVCMKCFAEFSFADDLERHKMSRCTGTSKQQQQNVPINSPIEVLPTTVSIMTSQLQNGIQQEQLQLNRNHQSTIHWC